MSQNFVFESKQKTFTYALMGVGVLCMLLTFVGDDELHTRFWSNFLHNTAFFTGIGFISLFILSAFTVSYAGWYVQFKRIWESFGQFMLVGLVLMAIIVAGVWGHFHHLYHWADAEAVASDRILSGKSSFLNPVWYTLASVGFLAIWYFGFYKRFRALSLREDEEGPGLRLLAAVFLPIAGFTSAAAIWQWLMSIDSHWYSTMYAWYTGASWFVSAMSLTVLLMIYLKSKGYFGTVTTEHFHDLGKFVFAFSIFWTYLWFSQYMLIWYSNNGEETVYFQTRQRDYPVLFYGNLIINFALPLLVLMRNDTKRKNGTLAFVAGAVFLGHWIDFFQMVKPGALHTAHEAMAHHAGEHADAAAHAAAFTPGFTIPGLLELGTMLGFLGLFLFVFFNTLSKAALVPKHDPYLAESLHHHT